MLIYYLKKTVKSFFNGLCALLLFYAAHTLIGFISNILFFLPVEIRTGITVILAVGLSGYTVFRLSVSDAKRDIAYHTDSAILQIILSLIAYGVLIVLLLQWMNRSDFALLFSLFTVGMFGCETAAHLLTYKKRQNNWKTLILQKTLIFSMFFHKIML